MRRISLSRWVAGAVSSESSVRRRCCCQAVKPSQRFRLYECFEPLFAMSALANGEADSELYDMRVLPGLPESSCGGDKIVRRRTQT